MTSAFDPKNQELNIESKIVVALERISEAFKVSLWNENKKYGLSPIQLQILTFLLFHSQELRTISHLAKEFNSTKASISDSVKTLETKKMLTREKSSEDFRIFIINLTEQGKVIAENASSFAEHIEQIVSEINTEKKEILLDSLLNIIHKLYMEGIISIQRMCLTCNYYIKPVKDQAGSCSLLDFSIKNSEIRVDCNEYS